MILPKREREKKILLFICDYISIIEVIGEIFNNLVMDLFIFNMINMESN